MKLTYGKTTSHKRIVVRPPASGGQNMSNYDKGEFVVTFYSGVDGVVDITLNSRESAALRARLLHAEAQCQVNDDVLAEST